MNVNNVNALTDGMTRRSFAMGAAMGAAALAGGMAAAQAHADEPAGAGAPQMWDYEADLVIVGGGGAGFMAALAAAEEGASSVILEKGERCGGDSAVCAGIFIGYNPQATLETSGEQDDFDTWLNDQLAGHEYSQKGLRGEEVGDTRLVELQAQLTEPTFQWLVNEAGVRWDPYDYCHNCWTPQPSWDTVYPRDWIAPDRFFPNLEEMAEANDAIQVATQTRVFEIIQNDGGRAIGVRAVSADGALVAARARKAVIITSGSFSADQGMVAENLGFEVGRLTNPGTPTCTGDGLKMVEQIGGKLRDLDLGTAWFTGTRGSNSLLLIYSMSLYGDRAGKYMPGILVNHEGVRYASENMGYNLGGKLISEQTWAEAFYVADSVGATVDEEGSLFSAGTHVGDDNILEAQSLEDLAKMMNVPEDAFLAQVERWNGFIDAGEDGEFGRRIDGCARIETAPFYAIPLHAEPYTTYGGIAVDADCRVLDVSDQPMPGLYAAGICTGSFAEQAGLFYLGGVSQTLIFGRLAGQKAAAEEPWE